VTWDTARTPLAPEHSDSLPVSLLPFVAASQGRSYGFRAWDPSVTDTGTALLTGDSGTRLGGWGVPGP